MMKQSRLLGRTLREVPRQAEILRDVRRLCPDAWVIQPAIGLVAMYADPPPLLASMLTFTICPVPLSETAGTVIPLETLVLQSMAKASPVRRRSARSAGALCIPDHHRPDSV